MALTTLTALTALTTLIGLLVGVVKVFQEHWALRSMVRLTPVDPILVRIT